jgi:NAD(P)-dependent dehydrogenase (short-subunit alcohol dehydrogenase family)
VKHKLRPLSDQVMVITGASSGIGLVAARQAAAAGAAVVLAARNTGALETLAAEINAAGGRAVAVTTDVGHEEDVDRLATAAIAEFGRFDTWVNNAGVSIYGMVDEVSVEDMRRMFDTNYWGVVYGSRAALAHYRGRTDAHGFDGAIINVGSVFGDRATAVQSTYSSSKHAVHGWTDAMRMDMEAQKVPVSVTLLHPGRIDTPYNEHAHSYMEHQPAHRGRIYPPEAVAEAIVHAAAHSVRDLFIGGQVKIAVTSAALAPRITDRVMERYMFWSQLADRPSRPRAESGLHHPGYGLEERGTHAGHLRSRSYYLKAEKHPALVVTAVGMAATVLLLAASRRS